MAFLDSNVQSTTQNAGDAGQVAGAGTPTAPNVSGAGGSDIGAVSTAGIGQGGTGGWTNIQAYLNANQGDQGSANNLRDSVGGQFSKEQGNIQDQADKTVKDANDYVTNNKISNDQANDLIGQAAKAYSYPGADASTKDPAYSGIVNRVQSALNGQWEMPTSFAPGLSAQSQNYGDQVNNDSGFQNLMSKLYSDKAGTPLTSGQSALQNQFDSGNQSLAQARQGLQGQYQGLQKTAGDLGQNVTNTLNADQKQFQTNQGDFKDYLGQQSSQYGQAVGKDEQDARNAYQGEYTGNSGHATALLPLADSGLPYAHGSISQSGNATWQQLQNEQNTYNQAATAPYAGSGLTVGDYYYLQHPPSDLFRQMNGVAQANGQALGNFYNTEDQKYANTGDADKRAFNSIQDFLGLQGNQKQQGFNVRG